MFVSCISTLICDIFMPRYVVKTLEQLITDDYVLVYLHGAASRTNAPTFMWLKSCYQLLDRRLRKSMRTLYIVHPSMWLKSMVLLMRPFIRYIFYTYAAQ